MTDEESLLAAIHEDVALSRYDGAWPSRFTAEKQRLMGLFPATFVDIQHIGSTAVEGLDAKPVIDLLAGVESMTAADALAGPLCRSGYTTSAEFNASLTDRKWFMRWVNGHRTHHLHVVVYAGNIWRHRLRFRDALRTSAELASQYAALKARLAAAHRDDREAYTHAKDEFVRAVAGEP